MLLTGPGWSASVSIVPWKKGKGTEKSVEKPCRGNVQNRGSHAIMEFRDNTPGGRAFRGKGEAKIQEA